MIPIKCCTVNAKEEYFDQQYENQVVRSSNINKAFLPESTANKVIKVSVDTFSKADSVLWKAVISDWNGSNSFEEFIKNGTDCDRTTFTNRFDKNDSLETKLFKQLSSKPCFLSRGCTTACWRQFGTTPKIQRWINQHLNTGLKSS